MDLLTTILTCSLYLADDDLVRAIAESNPQSHPEFVLDAALDLTQVDPPPTPKTATDALARAQEILAEGGRPVLGLLQVTPAWLGAFGRSLESAFDPCTNVAVGTAMLAQFDAECGGGRMGPRRHAPSAGRRSCVLRKYEEAIRLIDFATIVKLELAHHRPLRATVLDAPIFAPTLVAQAWGPEQLLVPLTPLSSTFASSP